MKFQAFFRSAALTLVDSVKVTEVRRQQEPAAERQEMCGALATQQRRKGFCRQGLRGNSDNVRRALCMLCFLFSVKKTLLFFIIKLFSFLLLEYN